MKILGLTIPFTNKKITENNNLPMRSPQGKTPRASYNGSGSGYNSYGHNVNYKSGGAKWYGGMSNTSYQMIYDHWLLRQRGRQSYQDSVHAHGLVSRWADSIADTGLKLDCNPLYDILGITPENAEKWSKEVEEKFNLWAMNKKQHRSETYNFYQSHRFYQKNKRRDGECFIRLYYSKDRNLVNPVQFEFIDPNQIRGNAFTNTLGPYAQEDGIERDERGREKSYKVWYSTVVNGKYDYKDETIPRIGEKSKRLMMIHAFEPEYPGQKRGFSELAHFLQEFEKLTDFTLAQIQKAINQSNIVLAIENNLQDPSNPFADAPIEPPGGDGFGVLDDSSNIDPTGDGSTTCNTDNRYDIQHRMLNEVDTHVPGSMSVLNTRLGDKLKAFENTAPSDSYESFENAFLSSLSSSSGMPLSVLKMKMEASYSAARGELLLFWRSVMIGRENQSADYCTPVFEMWLSEEIAAGRITAPGFNDPILRGAWLNCTWIGGPMPNIDPLRTAKGTKEYLSMSATTGERVSREHNGSEFKSNIMKNKKGFEEMPIPPWERKNQGGFNNG